MERSCRYNLVRFDPEDEESESAIGINRNPSLKHRLLTGRRFTLLFLLLAVTVFSVWLWGTPWTQSHINNKSGLFSWSSGLATTVNGTYSGAYDAVYDQYLFLGMPYAKPPVGPFRFRIPQPSNESWDGVRQADQYGPSCIGYANRPNPHPQDEDCLTINVIRPAADTGTPLPVAVYLFGGGRHYGGSSDGRYNLSYLVSHATQNKLPFIGVSLNFRVAIWGYIASNEVQGTGNSNLSLRDQRLALHWIQENIQGFGGDPSKVTIWGGSSGADDVGLHLTAYGGRDDHLFRAAILQSGGPATSTGFLNLPAQGYYDKISEEVGCLGVEDTLECMRQLPTETINNAYNESINGRTVPMLSLAMPKIDGDIIRTYGSLSIQNSAFVKIPIMSGVVTNEGSSLIAQSIKNWDDLRDYLTKSPGYNMPLTIVDRLLAYYEEPTNNYSEPLNPPIISISDKAVFNRIEQVLGDLEVNAAQRLLCQQYAKPSTCYSFRFDAIPARAEDPRLGVMHGDEIGPVFQDIHGIDFKHNPFMNKSEAYFEMSRVMGLMWAGFITNLDPNTGFISTHREAPWPKYTAETPRNIVFNETGPYWTELDTHRQEAMSYINRIQHSVLER